MRRWLKVLLMRLSLMVPVAMMKAMTKPRELRRAVRQARCRLMAPVASAAVVVVAVVVPLQVLRGPLGP